MDMSESKVALLITYGWMGKVFNPTYPVGPLVFGADGRTIGEGAQVQISPTAAKEFAVRAPCAKTLQYWREVFPDSRVDLISFCLPESMSYEAAKSWHLAGKDDYCAVTLAEMTDEESKPRVYSHSEQTGWRSNQEITAETGNKTFLLLLSLAMNNIFCQIEGSFIGSD